MTTKILLVLTIGCAIALGLMFGWKRSLKRMTLWGLIGACLAEACATAMGFNKGFSDTLLKQVLIILGIGFPVFVAARHASIWKGVCSGQGKRMNLKTHYSAFAIHALGLFNLWLPASGLIITGVVMLYARVRHAGLMDQLVDSARFQSRLSFSLILAYILSAMPIGVYITSVVLFYGAAKILVGFAVLAAGHEYRYCSGKALISKLQARLFRKHEATPH